MNLLFSLLQLLLHCYHVNALTASELSKFSVSGSHQATVSMDTASYNDRYKLAASGMPDHAWQRVNPNAPRPQNYNLHIPKSPTVESNYGCLPMGLIAVSRTGVAMFNPLTSSNNNAVEGSDAETFDNCDGHADPHGRYHYHKYPSSCMADGSVDEFIGVAMDGYPIYGPNATWKSAGKVITADLDRCHGKIVNGAYRYYVTEDWPYFLACFRGKVMDSSIRTSYNCKSTSGFDGSWGYMCGCNKASVTRQELIFISMCLLAAIWVQNVILKSVL